MICVTGTPGVGKSAAMKELLNRGCAASEFDGLIDECVLEVKDDERIVDQNCLRRIRSDGTYFGHLSHYARCDKVVVIRAHLKDIEIRLSKRGYSRSKIMDNVESEAIDLIGFEAEKMHSGNTFEVLNLSVEETADFIENVIKGKNSTSVKIDLLEEILDWY